MKKLISLLLVAALLCSVFCLTGCQPQTKTCGDYEYIIKSGCVRITGFTAGDDTPEIPKEIEGKPVTAIEESAFAGSITLKSLVIPEGVTEIGAYAFECCSVLESVTLPASLRSIGKGAFSGCVALTAVEIPEGVESIGDGAFFFCRKLTSVSLPGSLREVGNFLFAECDNLTRAEIAEGLPAVSERMFWHCSALQSALLPQSVTSIGKLAFAGCETLTEFKMPEAVTEIGEFAFRNCSGLRELTVGVETVSRNAFCFCYGLQSLTVAEGVKVIEAGAFENASCPGTLVIPASVTEIQPGAFSFFGTESFVVDEANTAYKSVDGVIFSKDGTRLISYPSGRTETSYTIPETVTSIAPRAFSGVYQLETLTIPAGVTTLEDEAFYEFIRLPELIIPETVTSVGARCFAGSGVSAIRMECPITELPEESFKGCNAEIIILPDTLEIIGRDAFNNAGCLMELCLPKALTTVTPGAFFLTGCEFSSDSPNFKVENGAVYTADGKTLVCRVNSSDRAEFTIPEGVETVDAYAVDCRNLTEITIPESLKTVGEYGLGYMFYSADPSPVLTLTVYGPAASPVRDYARENRISYFTGAPAQNVTELTLAGDETASFVIKNALADDVSYSSFDSDIVSVAQDGTVTAHKAGTADVYAAVGSTVFKCSVTVTSDGKPNKDAFDAGKYKDLAAEEVPAWVEAYLAFNNETVSVGPDLNPFAAAYKGENYFEGIWAAQVEESDYDKGAVDLFGEDFRPQMRMMGHGLETELSRYEPTDDLVLYSGTVDFSRFIGKPATLQNLRESIGSEITEPFFLSTALEESVTPTFAGPYCSVFIIYADKELMEGGYIESTVGRGAGGEYEYLMLGNVKMKIIDTGVRRIELTDEWTGEVSTLNETYMKVQLLPKD